jgi:hypothetical protein
MFPLVEVIRTQLSSLRGTDGQEHCVSWLSFSLREDRTLFVGGEVSREGGE